MAVERVAQTFVTHAGKYVIGRLVPGVGEVLAVYDLVNGMSKDLGMSSVSIVRETASSDFRGVMDDIARTVISSGQLSSEQADLLRYLSELVPRITPIESIEHLAEMLETVATAHFMAPPPDSGDRIDTNYFRILGLTDGPSQFGHYVCTLA